MWWRTTHTFVRKLIKNGFSTFRPWPESTSKPIQQEEGKIARHQHHSITQTSPRRFFVHRWKEEARRVKSNFLADWSLALRVVLLQLWGIRCLIACLNVPLKRARIPEPSSKGAECWQSDHKLWCCVGGKILINEEKSFSGFCNRFLLRLVSSPRLIRNICGSKGFSIINGLAKQCKEFQSESVDCVGRLSQITSQRSKWVALHPLWELGTLLEIHFSAVGWVKVQFVKANLKMHFVWDFSQ